MGRITIVDGFRREVRHRDRCPYEQLALDALRKGVTDDHALSAFCVYQGEVIANRRGYGRGSCRWLKFKCNGRECPAFMLVRIDVLGRFVTTANGSRGFS